MSETAYAPVAPAQRKRLSTRKKLGMSRVSIIGAVVSLAFAVFGGVTAQSGGLLFASGAVLALIFLLLWQENEPPLLLFPALYQWLAVSTKPIMSLFTGVPVDALADFDIDLDIGVMMGLATVAALTIGMRLGAGVPRRDWNAALKNEAHMVTPRSVIELAVSTILIGHFLFFLMRFAGPASQLLYALANVRFVGLFALAYWCFISRRGFGYLVAVSLVEVFIGITGFFSDFKTPIFIIAFAAIAAGHRPKVRDAVLVSMLAGALLVMGSFWSEVKMDYRIYSSGGSQQQEFVVPLSDRLDYLVQEAKTFDGERFSDGFDRMLRRQSYIDFLSATMSYVPEVVPHEHGMRAWRTLIHVITPRILFPNKPPTEFDTEVTVHYTGLPIRLREGTSISIGYVGELYIDFGAVGAVIATFVLGLIFGFAYQFLRGRSNGSVLLTYGIRATAVFVLLPFETALIKYVGGAGVAFIAAYMLQRAVAPWLSQRLRWRQVRPQNAAPSFAH
jgi:hypothetical protein